ncbi:MAG: hypothetical protein AAF184_13445, partial [Pseudomonadota bacterium]
MGQALESLATDGRCATVDASEVPNGYRVERVTWVHHWNEHLFSFRTTRDAGFRFRNGHFVMLGLPDVPKPCVRAYSIASPNYEECLEFF